MRAALAAIGLAVAMTGAPVRAEILAFGDLAGWQTDDHRAALQTFLQTCDLIEGAEWRPLCNLAPDASASDQTARQFFELFFRPVVIGDTPALFTGYYEPEFDGSYTRTPRFAYPLYARPPELRDGEQFLSRSTIEGGALRGRGLEIAWLDDPVDVYFLQVQGSGRIRMPDGNVLRLGYAGRNGFEYRSVGQEMVRRGTHSLDQVSAQEIARYVRAGASDLLSINPSYVFFRKLDLAPEVGPIGAMTRSITPLRSLAVDPAFTPLGAPVWIEKDGTDPMTRLMVAQDTGGAIKGAQRADIYYGTGPAAGDAAGTVKDGGRMVVLLPIDRAYAMVDGL